MVLSPKATKIIVRIPISQHLAVCLDFTSIISWLKALNSSLPYKMRAHMDSDGTLLSTAPFPCLWLVQSFKSRSPGWEVCDPSCKRRRWGLEKKWVLRATLVWECLCFGISLLPCWWSSFSLPTLLSFHLLHFIFTLSALSTDRRTENKGGLFERDTKTTNKSTLPREARNWHLYVDLTLRLASRSLGWVSLFSKGGPEFLTECFWGKAGELAFLTSFQCMLVIPGSHFKKHCLSPTSSPSTLIAKGRA